MSVTTGPVRIWSEPVVGQKYSVSRPEGVGLKVEDGIKWTMLKKVDDVGVKWTMLSLKMG